MSVDILGHQDPNQWIGGATKIQITSKMLLFTIPKLILQLARAFWLIYLSFLKNNDFTT